MALPDAEVGASDGFWTGSPPPYCIGADAVFDSLRDRMLVFGGRYSGPGAMILSLSLAGAPHWSFLTASLEPPPFGRYTTFYDPAADRVLAVDDGYSTWSLSLGGSPQWSHVTTIGAPPSRRFSGSLAFDWRGRRLILFGGAHDTTYLADVWALDLSGAPTWKRMDPEGAGPIPREGARAVYDPIGDRVVILGGYAGSWRHSFPSREAWALELSSVPRWVPIDSMQNATDNQKAAVGGMVLLAWVAGAGTWLLFVYLRPLLWRLIAFPGVLAVVTVLGTMGVVGGLRGN